MGGTAIVFAGQGAQFVGMGKDLAEAFPASSELFERANSALGTDLRRICFEGPEEELTKTSNCQPAIFVVSIVCLAALRAELGELNVSAAAGLSLGEWSALHMAGSLSFEDVLRVLEARGRFMQEACDASAGGMVSIIGLDMSAIEKICEEAGVGIANLNSPGQTVLSGERSGIERASSLATQAGAKRAIVLNVAGAYHSSLMADAAEKLEEVLHSVEISAPSVPVLSNVSGKPHGSADEIRSLMVAQVTSTVRWIDDVEWMKTNGITQYVECGPGKVLSGLIKRIDNTAALHNIQDRQSLQTAAAALQGAT